MNNKPLNIPELFVISCWLQNRKKNYQRSKNISQTPMVEESAFIDYEIISKDTKLKQWYVNLQYQIILKYAHVNIICIHRDQCTSFRTKYCQLVSCTPFKGRIMTWINSEKINHIYMGLNYKICLIGVKWWRNSWELSILIITM